ncbi:mediator of RNA polymerase II transcription subunit 13 isoform X1 [Apis mellifera caucasica]|uniref:Mediator of RNA polymerase II transcription subunit 13 n=3 Tax=Apis TaxID=7459 RepID=A0A7M7L9E3_APIME|nr:mediator of RNA polymerase II transcription subunit 13 isoform X1 [Apis mellifera]KAG6796514.1 mediator of RNA polymerase II transcription subunit 13 isoform X1 [Apis mellifera caucasica]KAG9436590.1 mediator of RNA polymerase II transcription subunit 13 isoform X1 [Apis mellifera carnica]|eukprot:XP_026297299.1 mediator of RNA polymerase II transcription subunit 13 isoform X1 [Apis mellifera]
MTHPSHQTNGASLEDCHTNFFALTDLCGIKWKKLVWGEVAGDFGGTPLEDPVLSSFSRCLAGDILCVWRRVAATPATSGPATASATGAGIFDLGIAPSPAPPPLSLTAAKELWIFWYGEEPDLSGLVSPELIACESEQGSWESGLSYECRSLLFKALHNLIERCLLSRDFVRLGKWFVQPYDGFEKHRCSSSHLSFSFAFFVHGESTVCASVDVRQHPAVRHLTRTCLQRTQTSQSGVKVILAPYGLAGTLIGPVGRIDSQLLEEWKHFYPINSSNIEAGLPPLVEVLVGGVRMRYPSCYVLVTDMDDSPPDTPLSPPSSPASCEHPLLSQQELQAATELPERVWAECTLSSPISASKTESSTELGTWTFIDPTQKSSCICSKSATPGGWKSLASSQVQRDKGGRRVVPFHRRSTTQWDACPSVPANAPRSVLNRTEAPSTPPGGPPSYSRGPPTGGDCLPVPSVGSPGSPAPSPLPTPHSEPASVPPAEPTMPTLSPQPPPSHANTAPPLTPSQGPKSTSSACNNQVHSPVPGPTLKRPVLVSRECEEIYLENEQSLRCLYDYSIQEAWLNHPVKRFKESNNSPVNVRNNTLYPPMNSQIPQSQTPKIEIKQEPNVNVGDCIGRRTDPYEFDAAGEENGTSVDGLRRQRDDPSKPGSLFTSEGLQASYKDLDQIFDNSDPDTSSDETNLNQLQVQTPPESNRSGGLHEETRVDANNRHSNRGVGVLRPEELSKMFPTPPSLEHNPVASPCQLNDSLMDQTELSVPQRPLRHLPDIYPNMGSPQEEPIDDWSYVFKPAPICKMVGSSKYAPLTNLPSQSLPPVTLPSHCVYRPSWQCNPTSNNPDKPLPPTRPGSVQQQPCPPSPAPLGAPYRSATISGRPPPPPYDQPSPATSTTSSYLNKNLNSIEADTPGPTRAPESNSLIVNILLGDTVLNIFRDHNFDSCSLCVCNAGPKVVGNIKGADAGVYLTHSWSSGALFQDDDQIRCSCGFSAVVNRRLAHQAGLFYEDEMEITGIAEDPAEKKKASLVAVACGGGKPSEGLDVIPPSVLELLREQCLIIQSSASSLYRASRIYATMKSYPMLTPTINMLEFNDGNEVSLAALDQGKINGTHNERTNRIIGVHRWVFLRAKGPQCSGDIVRMMRALQPLLQDAVQKKCTTRMWEAPYTVAGPLTWRQFHRLAGRGTDDRCEPQPIPALVVGYDRDWLSLSPYALSYWEKLLLEPYAGPRDVAYVVVAPDSDCVVNKVKSFFRELSTTYEICRLGRHTPISKALRDGILRVGKSSVQKQIKQPIDDWFKLLGENQLGELLRLYAQVCNHRLAPYLTQVIQDRSLLDSGDSQSNKQQQQQQPQTTIPVTDTMPATPDVMSSKPESIEGENPRSETPSSNTTNTNSNTGNTTPTSQTATVHTNTTSGPDEEEVEPPAIVVYLVEPFSLGGPEDPDRRRLAILALLRAYSTAINSMPENIRSNINVQIISLESIMELGRARERRKIQDEMRALALNVFLQGRRLLNHNSTVKSLTGFGTAAAADLFLKSKDSYSNTLATIHQERNRAPYRLYSPAYVLAPLRAKSEAPESFGIAGPEECAVLYLSYCLSEDQSWLLAVATDDRGEIFETATINIDIPNRKRRKRASARRIGLQKLMDFILSVMSQGVQPWRLVVGRVGRIGHGELKGWSWLLSRKALLKASKHLKEICGQCSLLYPSAAPCVLSACLVSLEPDSTLRLMADQFTPDERFSQASVNCQLSTPQDVTCTHILVFPTSATTQSSQTAFQEQHINGPELGDDELFSALNDDMPEGMEGMGDFNDIFNVWPEAGAGGGQSPGGSPHRPEGSPMGGDGGGSGLGNHDGPGSPFPCSNTPRVAVAEQAEEVGTLLQQPLALGYLVSTAPTGRMPPWFWSACPHLEGVCPVFLKNALHLHSPAIQQNSDDLLQQQSALTAHPLDSQYTTDVLRYVLEGYNALSWLAVDANTKDRLSCLPVHVQALMQLYHAAAALV